jgi:2'-5' RNA ligase
MHLLLGIELPDELKDFVCAALALARRSAKVWEEPHDYHQTLLFIGEVAPDVAARIEARLATFDFRRFWLTLGEFRFFNRRVLHLGFQYSPELTALKRAVDDHFADWGRTGEKPFVPHVTVKRWQLYEYEQLVGSLGALELPGKQFEVRCLSLRVPAARTKQKIPRRRQKTVESLISFQSFLSKSSRPGVFALFLKALLR